MPDSRGSDRTPVHFTMKAPHPSRASPGPRPSHMRTHSRSSSLTKMTGRSSKPSTPIASPHMPYSVGQPYPPPPRLSPGRPLEGRSASPNYFGLVPEASVDSQNSTTIPRDNWSPATSSIKSFNAAVPKQVAIDANPDYEAFKKQADLNHGTPFSLSGSQLFPGVPGQPPVRPRPPPRWHTHASDSQNDLTLKRGATSGKERPLSRMDIDIDTLHDSAYVSLDSKRNSEASTQPPSLFDMPRFESPRPAEPAVFDRRTTLSKVEDRHPRLSVSQHKIDPPPPNPDKAAPKRAETEPPTIESGPSLITPSQLKHLLEEPECDTELLLLDLRVSQQYQQGRIEGALNLCTPTTLLKRATFNLQRLQQTFQNPPDKEKFSKWAEARNLVVYDAHSTEKRDAVSCMNMIKKFVNEGYKGGMYILRGGFNAFYDNYPEFVDEGAAAGYATGGWNSQQDDANRSGIPPVIGGVMLPKAADNPNPFFSNIRQNVDLADGVGQLDISRPSGLDSPSLPRWLRHAAVTKDHGRLVSEKFLEIEKDEQARMKKAYSVFNTGCASPTSGSAPVLLSGIEKGNKNRYKDILPFEHSRVKLQGRPAGSCDYVNASHIKASRSNKRYIATQGPLPATFEDFWSVIWDQDVRVVVMLTAESEGGQLKCHPYWKTKEVGHIRLRLLSEKKVSLDIDKQRANSQVPTGSPYSTSSSESGRRRANTTTTLEGSNPTPQSMPSQTEAQYVIIRKFALSHASHPFAPIREVTHLHYPSWPDFGAPAQPSHLLALVELANLMQRAALPIDTPSIAASRTSPDPMPSTFNEEPEMDPRVRPMLVHCSAGCGRTGTFCTVDSVIDMLKRQRWSKTTLKPVRKRDSDGDIKMSGQREVEEPVSPRTAQEKAFNFTPSPPRKRTPSQGRRASASTDGSGKRSTFSGEVSSPPPLDVEWISDETIDLIAKTVEDFRSQRLSMVQSLRQFVLCYETVIEYAWRMHERSNVFMTMSASGPVGRGRSGSLQIGRE